MDSATLQTAGILLILIPTVAFGGASILNLWITRRSPYYHNNPLRQRLWTAGHAHAGVLLVLSLVAFNYLQYTNLGPGMQAAVRTLIASSAIFVPAAFFLSVVKADAEKPNGLINLAYVGFLTLTTGLLILGFGVLGAL